jgi:hypothetical protein
MKIKHLQGYKIPCNNWNCPEYFWCFAVINLNFNEKCKLIDYIRKLKKEEDEENQPEATCLSENRHD